MLAGLRAEQPVTCPHDYRWHSRKNANQMPAMSVQITALRGLQHRAEPGRDLRAEEGGCGEGFEVARLRHAVAAQAAEPPCEPHARA
eukprot:COSAG04_NODE_91_length_26852_cov_8.609315_27_plen_87_part_00